MTTQIECPICMDSIDINKNYTTTECGHCFHSNCLMKNVAHNGFGCPYCRTTMAEVPDNDDASLSSSQDGDEDIYNNDVLRGLRFFNNNLQGIIHDEDDEDAEDDYLTELLETEEPDLSIPTTQFISNKLREQVNYEQLVSLILFNDHEEYDNDALERLDGEVYGKIRRIISNYTPPEPEQQVNEIQLVGRTIPTQVQLRLVITGDENGGDEVEHEVEHEVLDELEYDRFINTISDRVKKFQDYKKKQSQQLIKFNIRLSISFQELLLGKILFVFILYACAIVIVN